VGGILSSFIPGFVTPPSPVSKSNPLIPTRFITRLLLAALLLWLLDGLRPAPVRVQLTGGQTVITLRDHVCVHTRLIDEVEEWKIQESLTLARHMGAGMIVEFFPWAYLEPQRGQYDWQQADRIIRHARDQGVRVIARLGLVPAWAREPAPGHPPTTLNTLPDAAFADFAAFAAAFANRYRTTIRHFIIWNEPNLAFEWGYQPVDPLRYARLLAVTAPAIRAAHPGAIILGGALAPTLEPPGSPHGWDDRLYLEALYAAGAADHFDALAVHTYGFTAPANAPPDAAALNFRRVEVLRAVMEQHGDSATPIYITESGWNDDPRWTQAVTPSQRVAYTLDALRRAETWPWLETLCLWVLRTPALFYSYPDHFALVTPDFYPRPIYHAVRAYALGEPFTEDLWLPPPAAR